MDRAEFGERIRALRKAAHLTQEELGKLLNVTGQAVAHWEAGRSLPQPTEVPAIAAALGVTICELYGVEEGHERTGAQAIRDRFVETVAAELTDADLELLAEIGASLERYRAKLLDQESQP